LTIPPLRLRRDRTEYGTYKLGCFRVGRGNNEGRNIALFALDDEKIITEKR
ncbi:hypothetical protein HMPREF1870_00987, partial [Bacteroidales bacterium KA00344]